MMYLKYRRFSDWRAYKPHAYKKNNVYQVSSVMFDNWKN